MASLAALNNLPDDRTGIIATYYIQDILNKAKKLVTTFEKSTNYTQTGIKFELEFALTTSFELLERLLVLTDFFALDLKLPIGHEYLNYLRFQMECIFAYIKTEARGSLFNYKKNMSRLGLPYISPLKFAEL